MSFARRLMLVGSDHRFAQTIQTHFHKSFLLTVPAVRSEDVPRLVTRDTDGAVLFLAADAADAERIEAGVRELRVQLLPPKLAVLEVEPFADGRRLDPLTSYLAGRFTWPTQARELNAWTRRAVVQGVPFVDPAAETVPERVRRTLLTPTPSLAPLADQLATAAAHDVPVLIEGEPGSGKSHLAKLIHDCSGRAAHRFVAVNCAALSGAALAGELFGHAGATEGEQLGKLAAAAGGTLLLDEIDALGPDLQAALLRVIETGEYEPVGGTAAVSSRARVVAATNGSLAEAVERGAFRRDLYYRLNVLAFQAPSLRSRPQDVGPLVRSLVARYGTRFGKPLYAVAPDALRALEQFPWPGNIRQLENVIQQAVLTAAGDLLTAEHLPSMIHVKPAGRSALSGSSTNLLAHNRETTERAVIVRALEKVSFSRTRAAELLGVSRVTLYKKMKKYGLLTTTSGTPAAYDLSTARYGS